MYPLIHFFAIKILLYYLERYQSSELPTYIVYILMLVILVRDTYLTGYEHIQKAATQNSRITNAFNNGIMLIKNSKLIDQETNVVIFSEQYIDFEAISSISRYLHYYTSHGSIMLNYKPQGGELSELATILQQRLTDVVEGKNGDDKFFDLFTRYETPSRKCVSIVIGKANNILQCPIVAIF